MLSFPGWPLLLACALVQRLLLVAGRRSAVALAAVASAAHAAAAAHARTSPVEACLTLAAFWAATWAIVATHASLSARLAATETLCDIDEATGCLNRRGFRSRLDRSARAALRSGRPIALLALDLDHFKRINDEFGHLSGDAVLQQVSASLRETVGALGVVSRLGGEEFAVLLPEADAEEAGVVAERILASLRSWCFQGLPAGVRLSMSAGIAAERLRDLSMTDALRARADEALYVAKRMGRDRALLWAPGVRSHATPVRSLAVIPAGRTAGAL